MQNQFIFYGAGRYAEYNLDAWLAKGVVPLCFADSDKSKHHKKMRAYIPARSEFEILPLQEALIRHPEADICVTLDYDSYQSIYDYLINKGVRPQRIGAVPDTATGKEYIFYGAGRRAEENLRKWVFDGIVPVCFADSNESKQHTLMRIQPPAHLDEFEILPIHEALERHPQAFIYITTNPDSYQSTYNFLIGEGILPKHIGSPPLHCSSLGSYFMVESWIVGPCCRYEYNTYLQRSGNIKKDVQAYYSYCKKLREGLNEGRLVSCTGCYQLLPGRSDEEHKIKQINLGTGLSGGTDCNLMCSYCTYAAGKIQRFNKKSDNVLEMLQFFTEMESIDYLLYNAGEITVSPYRLDIMKLIKNKKLRAKIFTNATTYMNELKDLLSENLICLNVSLDAGTARTFEKIKGVDCFDKVVGNLKKYAESGGSIELKYIVLEGINCEESDIDGFVGIAEELCADVIISRCNCNQMLNPPTSEEYSAILCLARSCIMKNISYSFSLLSTDYLDRLKQDCHAVFGDSILKRREG